MEPITDLDTALARIDSFDPQLGTCELPLADLILDPVGINIAILTDRALGKGWEPDGFVQHAGYRVLRYRFGEAA